MGQCWYGNEKKQPEMQWGLLSKKEKKDKRRRLADLGSVKVLNDLPPHVKQLTKADSKARLLEAATVIASGFCGSLKLPPEGTTDWILGSGLRKGGETKVFEGPLDQPPQEKSFNAFKSIALFSINYALKVGGVVLVSEGEEGRIAAVGITFPPNNCKLHDVEKNLNLCSAISLMCKAGFWRLAGFVRSHYSKIKASGSVVKQMHEENAHGPHWYLMMLGTHQDLIGKGHGKSILLTLNRCADADQCPLYLETFGEHNERLYARFGYEVKKRYNIMKGSPPLEGLAAMVRSSVVARNLEMN